MEEGGTYKVLVPVCRLSPPPFPFSPIISLCLHPAIYRPCTSGHIVYCMDTRSTRDWHVFEFVIRSLACLIVHEINSSFIHLYGVKLCCQIVKNYNTFSLLQLCDYNIFCNCVGKYVKCKFKKTWKSFLI